MTIDEDLAYVAGFFDGEGYVHWSAPESRKPYRKIGFTNTNKEIFDFVCDTLINAGIAIARKYRVSDNPKHAPRWDGHVIGGEDGFRRFAAMVPIKHPGKVKRLSIILADYDAVRASGRKRRAYRGSRWTNTSPEERSAHSLMMRRRLPPGHHCAIKE